jgi:hypothetical protein
VTDFRGIAGVSSSLRRLLRDRIQLPNGVTETALQVTISSPKIELDGSVEPPRVNVFLYRATENGFLKNQEIPGQGHPASYGHPPLSLNLHYLLTAFGTTTTLAGETPTEERAHELLGSAMRVFHDFPVIGPDLVSVRAPVGQPILHESLTNEFEAIKVTLEPSTIEELSKVWTALTLPYRLSASYLVTVVQIESRLLRRTPLPVKTRRVHVATMQRPSISAVYRSPVAPTDPVGEVRVPVLGQMTIEGSSFRAAATRVRLGELDPFPVVATEDDKLLVTVPDVVAPPQLPLQPGAHVVHVITERAGEAVEGGLGHGVVIPSTRIETSNPSAFLLSPSLSGSAPALGPAGTVLTATGTRLFQPALKSVVLLGDRAIEVRQPKPGEPFAPPTPTSVQVVVPALPVSPTPYVLRVMVNGVTSIEERTFQVT